MSSNSKHTILKAIFLVLIYVVSVGFEPKNYPDSIAKYSASGDYGKAKEFLNESRLNTPIDNDSNLVEWLINHAQLTAIIGENDSALYSIQQALALSKKLNSKYLQHKIQVQQIEFNRKLRKYILAHKIIKALLKEGIEDATLRCRFYHRSAAVYNEMHYGNLKSSTLDSARLFAETALTLAKQLNNISAQATCYNELGDIYEKMNAPELSYKNYHEAIKLWKGENNFERYNAIKNLGKFFFKNQLYDSSLYYYNYALVNVKNSKDFALISNVYGGLKEAYFGKGDSLNGHKSHVYEVYNMALLGEQIMKSRINELYVELETEVKEKEIVKKEVELKQKDKQFKYFSVFGVLLLIVIIFLIYSFYISKKKNKLLRKLNDENQFLIGETNHRVKNNLQLIISLIGREMYKYKGEVTSLESISDKINAIASLHQQLYLNESISAISVKAYVYNIYENLKDSMALSDFNLEMDIEDTELPAEKATYLGLLITELITNTAKHAYDLSDEKLIGLKIFKKENKLVLNYFDNGKGIAEGIKLKLIDLLVKQLEGEITPFQHEGISGYSVQLKFMI
ncbi:MAG: sensor histidine kinase [Bacteroidetes bacterium]|nr:sensor histidine kinase [Bacteroidota bacterium]MCB0801827.1 sensor histidine kinase [Flavobacteriales bacterium]NOG57636.1 sensor histidine kinase [Bacteroidota bacterium]